MAIDGAFDGTLTTEAEVRTAADVALAAAISAGSVVQATETIAGKAEIATQGEVNTGTDDQRFVTPLKLATRLAAALADLVDSAPGALNTLNELAAALGDDANFASTVTTALAGKQPLDATLTGIAATTPTTDQILLGSGTDTFTTLTLGTAGKALLDDATAADARTTILAAPLRWTVVAETGTTKTLALSDEAKFIQHSNTSPVTVTLPNDTNAPTVVSGFALRYVQMNTGTVTFAADTGVTINSRGGLLSMNGRYSEVTVRKRGANTWIITGDLA